MKIQGAGWDLKKKKAQFLEKAQLRELHVSESYPLFSQDQVAEIYLVNFHLFPSEWVAVPVVFSSLRRTCDGWHLSVCVSQCVSTAAVTSDFLGLVFVILAVAVTLWPHRGQTQDIIAESHITFSQSDVLKDFVCSHFMSRNFLAPPFCRFWNGQTKVYFYFLTKKYCNKTHYYDVS